MKTPDGNKGADGRSGLSAGLDMRLQRDAKVSAENITKNQDQKTNKNFNSYLNYFAGGWLIDYGIGIVVGWLCCGIWYGIYFP